MATYNPGRDTNRSPLHQVAPLRAPYAVTISPSDRCNFRCNYCFHSVPEKVRYNSIMRWEDFLACADQLKALSDRYKLLKLYGYGEPLLNKRISDMVAHITAADMADRREITSNGYLLNDDLSLRLIDAGLTRLVISVQGVNAEAYRKVCGKDIDFEAFLKRLRFFHEHSGDCALHIKTLDTALDFNKGEDAAFLETFSPLCDTIHIDTTLDLFDLGLPEHIRERGNVTIQNFAVEESMCCSSLFYQLAIFANGDASACCGYPPFLLGNVPKDGLANIWNGKRHISAMKLHLQGKRDRIPVCAVCTMHSGSTMPGDNVDDHAEEILARLPS